MDRPRTIVEKIWDAHVISRGTEGPSILFIDLHLVHEVTSPQAFDGLRGRGYTVRRPELTIATVDHSVPTTATPLGEADPVAAAQVRRLEENCRDFGVPVIGYEHNRRGIVHVVGPELGLTQPGMTIVCGDSHTATHGAFGALAFGIGTSEVEHVLATQCLLQRPSRSFRVEMTGHLRAGVVAKDLILALISRIGVGGGTGCVIEYTGSAIKGLTMEERMTVCNMSIEAGARAGLIAPDETTYEFLAGRPGAPRGGAWDEALGRWSLLPSDSEARYDREVVLEASEVEPMITFGTHPGTGIAVTAPVPDPAEAGNEHAAAALKKALAYMALSPGKPLLGHRINTVFIGSCTNARLSDLRAAATIMRGRRVAAGVRVLVVPGSREVKRQAEAERLDELFINAGAEWRDAGCSMCIAMNGDELSRGDYCVSTSNRNFEGRQGAGGRTFLASPLTAAAAAITGVITDPRTFMR